MSTTKVNVSIETVAGLYAAAIDTKERADRAVERTKESIVWHGYTERQVLDWIKCRADATASRAA